MRDNQDQVSPGKSLFLYRFPVLKSKPITTEGMQVERRRQIDEKEFEAAGQHGSSVHSLKARVWDYFVSQQI